MHSEIPEIVEKRKKATSEGGKVRKKYTNILVTQCDIKVRSVTDIVVLLEDTINSLRKNLIDSKRANSVGYLANISLKAIL